MKREAVFAGALASFPLLVRVDRVLLEPPFVGEIRKPSVDCYANLVLG